jgi:streptogramin lyase
MLTRVTLLTLVALLTICAPVSTAAFLHLPRESAIGSLTVTPDGSAWFSVTGERVYGIGHATPAGRVHIQRVREGILASREDGLGAALAGPDGKAWFSASLGGEGELMRVDGDAHVTRVRDAVPFPATVGPDGTIWTRGQANATIVHVRPDGSSSDARIPAAPCFQYDFSSLATATDGAVWIAGGAGHECHYVVRIAPDGSGRPFFVSTEVDTLAPGPDDGVWFVGPAGLGRFGPTGAMSTYRTRPVERIFPAPDGTLYYTSRPDSCALRHLDPATGRTDTVSTPFVPQQLAFAPDGSVWLIWPSVCQVSRAEDR